MHHHTEAIKPRRGLRGERDYQSAREEDKVKEGTRVDEIQEEKESSI